MENKKHLSLTEAASVSGRSYWVLRSAVLSGALRGVQFTPRGKIYIRPEDLDAYFDSHAVSATSVKAAAK